MKPLFLTGILFTVVLFSCQQDKKTTQDQTPASTNTVSLGEQDVWAEQIEANTSLVKPEGWADEDWKAVNKNVAYQKIYSTITDAVISGKVKAYDFFTDSAYTVDDIKIRIENIKAENISSIRTREEWKFDRMNFKLIKEVSRINLFTQKLDENGEYLGDKALFYVKLDN